MDSCMHILDFIHQSSRTPFFARVITCEETNETRRAKRGANLLPLDPQEKRKKIPQDGWATAHELDELFVDSSPLVGISRAITKVEGVEKKWTCWLLTHFSNYPFTFAPAAVAVEEPPEIIDFICLLLATAVSGRRSRNQLFKLCCQFRLGKRGRVFRISIPSLKGLFFSSSLHFALFLPKSFKGSAGSPH